MKPVLARRPTCQGADRSQRLHRIERELAFGFDLNCARSDVGAPITQASVRLLCLAWASYPVHVLTDAMGLVS
jgi:hypothetical protein